MAPRPLVSTGHSQRRCVSRLWGVLFVIGSDDPHVPPLAQGQLFTARELHLCPSWISPTSSREKKMSLLPWRCQVMDFMFASGVQVKTWGSHWRWPSQPRHLYRGCACKHTDSHEELWKGGRAAPVSRVRLVCLLGGYCCACCKPERPWAVNSSIRRSPVAYNAGVISIGPAGKNIVHFLARDTLDLWHNKTCIRRSLYCPLICFNPNWTISATLIKSKQPA